MLLMLVHWLVDMSVTATKPWRYFLEPKKGECDQTMLVQADTTNKHLPPNHDGCPLAHYSTMSAISSLTFLNFNYAQNCSLSGHALAALYNDAAVPLPEIIELVQVLSPDHFANVSADTIIDWYNGIKSLDEELWAVQSIIKSECHREFCKALSREHALGIDETGVSSLNLLTNPHADHVFFLAPGILCNSDCPSIILPFRICIFCTA